MKCLHEQVNELRHMILMMTGQGEKEESRSENEKNRGGDNKENSGNVREKAGKKKKGEKMKKVRMEEGVGFVDMWFTLWEEMTFSLEMDFI